MTMVISGKNGNHGMPLFFRDVARNVSTTKRARYYAPPTFTSRDPLFEKYFWMSPYTYCANNPMKFVDPSGASATDFEDENGNRILHVEDGSNAVFRLTGNSQTKSYFEFKGYSNQGGTNKINMAGLIAGAQDYVMNNFSYCNQAVNFVGRTYNAILNKFGTTAEGGYAVNENKMANTISNELSNCLSAFYNKNTNWDDIKKAANLGNLVVGTAPGHVNMVTTGNFKITRYAKDGTSSTFDYLEGNVANVNGHVQPTSLTRGLGSSGKNSYYPMEYSHVTKFYSLDIVKIYHLAPITVTPN